MVEQRKEYLTAQKFEELQKELLELKTSTRKSVAEQLERAKALGDLSENAEYQEARENQAKVESRINQLESILKNAVIVSHKKSDVVEIGSAVVVKKLKEDEEKEYLIVGSEEADLSLGKLSYESPFGTALMDKKAGDKFVFESPRGKVEYEIISVE